jgi:hypothetical protein
LDRLATALLPDPLAIGTGGNLPKHCSTSTFP